MTFETLFHLLNSNPIMYSIILLFTLIVLIIASISDIRTREVPDTLNYGIIFGAIGLRLIYSTITFDWTFLIEGLTGLIVFIGIALVLFYTGQWGGGDSKLLMGMAALYGMQLTLNTFIFSFIINMFITGAFYGLLWSIVLLIKNREKFIRGFTIMQQSKEVRISKFILYPLIIASLSIGVLATTLQYKIIFYSIPAIIFLTFYLWIITKTIEKTCMIKSTTPKKLTEGDWIAKDVKVRGKYICGPRDLGIEKHQIQKLVKLKVKTIEVKEGIPFVPSFLFGFILTLAYGNWWILFLF
jgi:Flp pilus assembly protein protease CpaA